MVVTEGEKVRSGIHIKYSLASWCTPDKVPIPTYSIDKRNIVITQKQSQRKCLFVHLKN
jgi:hypothetical protein